MSVPFDVPRQPAAAAPRASNREEMWSLACVSCDDTVAAASRIALARVVRDAHDRCVTAGRVNVEYVVTTEATRQHPATRPHLMWMTLPASLLHAAESSSEV
jgi:hypothetical protein